MQGTEDILAARSSYRPRVIEGGYRRNRGRSGIRAGWPWIGDRWRIWQVEDGVLTWHHGQEVERLTAGMWAVHQADRLPSHVLASPGSHWAQLRFALCPGEPNGDPDSLGAWGAVVPAVLTAAQTENLRPALADVLAWWWRDSWHLARAEARLAIMLLDLAGQWRVAGGSGPRSGKRDAFTAADALWRTRPLVSMAELAAACGMAERTFRRRFQAARGRSPAAYARTVMAGQACDLLRDRVDWSVAAVARHLGYAHASTFIRAFTAEVGITPQRWRQRRQRS